MASRAVPIPIAPRSRGGANATTSSTKRSSGHGMLSASVPVAPIIGSLPPPSQLAGEMPDLSLPAGSPEAYSLAEIMTAETTQRLVGVSSAPARNFIENARRQGPKGASPTVLSVLQLRGSDDTFAGTSSATGGGSNSSGNMDKLTANLKSFGLGAPSQQQQQNLFAKQDVVSGGSGGGLSAMFKRGSSNGGNTSSGSEIISGTVVSSSFGLGGGGAGGGGLFSSSASSSSASHLSTSAGRASSMKGMVLATSFRDPAHMPPPLPEDLEGEEDETGGSSDEEHEKAAARRRAGLGGLVVPPPGGGGGGSGGNAAAAGGAGAGTDIDEHNDDDDEDDEDEDDEENRRRAAASRDDGGVFESEM